MSLWDIQFYLYFFFFLVAIFFAFYIPGTIALNTLRLTRFQDTVLSFLVGMCLWALTGYVFGLLQMRWLSYIYLLSCVIYWSRTNQKLLHTLPQQWQKIKKLPVDRISISIIVIGSLLQFSSVWLLGTNRHGDLFFCCRSVPDNLYHAALTQQLIQHVPPYEPGISGIVVHNYYYLSNLVIADLVRVFALPQLPTEYQYMPLFISLFYGLSAVVFVQLVGCSKTYLRWLLFFFYFHGDVLYGLIFLTTHILNFQYTILDDASKITTVPPRAMAILVFMAGVCLLVKWIKKPSTYTAILTSLLMGTLAGLKVYTAIFALSGLGIVFLYTMYKRWWKESYPFLIAFLVTALLYIPVNSSAGGVFFSGFWRLENFIAQEQFHLMSYDFALQVYVQHHNWLRIGLTETMFFVIYLVSMLGTITISFLQTKSSVKQFPLPLHLFLLTGIVVTGFLGLFTLQKTGGANTIQFIVFLYIAGAFYAALAMGYVIHHWPKKIGFVLACSIVLLTLPRVLHEVSSNLIPSSTQDTFTISSAALAGVHVLQQKVSQQDIIAVPPEYFDTYYYFIPLLSQRPVFLTGVGILQDHGAPQLAQRKKAVEDIFSPTDEEVARHALQTYHIRYIYSPASNHAAIFQDARITQLLYHNNDVVVYKVTQ